MKKLLTLLAGLSTLVLAGCHIVQPMTTVSSPQAGSVTRVTARSVASKTTATANEIAAHNGEAVVLTLAARIALLNGPATLEDVAEAKALIIATKEAWDKQLKMAEALGKKNAELIGKLDTAITKLQLIEAEAAQLRKDKAMEPFRRAMYAALLFLLYYAVVKKDPIQATLCGAIALGCGFAPWLYDSVAASYLVWLLCGGTGVYAVAFFYDLIRTRLGFKGAVAVAEKLKNALPEETPAVLEGASAEMSKAAKSAIKEVRTELGHLVAPSWLETLKGLFSKLTASR